VDNVDNSVNNLFLGMFYVCKINQCDHWFRGCGYCGKVLWTQWTQV